MRKSANALTWLVLTGFIACAAYAQQMTERFIPIGESPGLSRTGTVIGTVGDVDAQASTFVVSADGASRTVRVTAQTHVWLDRSGLKLANLDGGIADLKSGSTVEVKFRDPRNSERAEWVKVRVTSP